MSSLVKDPDAVLDYVMDWNAPPEKGGPWLATGETITAATVTVPVGITLNPPPHVTTFTTTAVTFWLAGGADGTDYVAVCRVTTNAGRTDDFSVTVKVRAK